MVRLTKDQYERVREEIKELAKAYYREKGYMPNVEEIVQRFGVSFSFAYTTLRLAAWELSHPSTSHNQSGDTMGSGGLK